MDNLFWNRFLAMIWVRRDMIGFKNVPIFHFYLCFFSRWNLTAAAGVWNQLELTFGGGKKNPAPPASHTSKAVVASYYYYFATTLSLSPAWTKNAVPPVLPIIKARRLSRAAYVTFHHWIKWVSFQKIKDDILRVLYIKANLKNLWKRGIFNADLKLKQIVNASKKNSL